jgi:hypothetical protein
MKLFSTRLSPWACITDEQDCRHQTGRIFQQKHRDQDDNNNNDGNRHLTKTIQRD